MLVSTRDGRNIRRSLDGARLTLVKGDWTVDLLAARPTLENADYFDNPPNHSSGFWAAYAVHPFKFLLRGNIDLYYMGLDNKNVPFSGKGAGREQRETIGTRLWGTTEHWDYNDEFAFQWGWFGSGDIRAWAVSTEHGYRLDKALSARGSAFEQLPSAAIRIHPATMSAHSTPFTRKALTSATQSCSHGAIWSRCNRRWI